MTRYIVTAIVEIDDIVSPNEDSAITEMIIALSDKIESGMYIGDIFQFTVEKHKDEN